MTLKGLVMTPIWFWADCLDNGWRYRLVYSAAYQKSNLQYQSVTCPMTLCDRKGLGRLTYLVSVYSVRGINGHVNKNEILII